MSLPFHLISRITLACALISSSATLWAKDYYKWVDANGSTHYTTTPPPKSVQKKGKVQTYGWNNSASTTGRSPQTPAENQTNTTVNTSAPDASRSVQAMPADTTKPVAKSPVDSATAQ
ncbi:DUF4124 domain-containing protein [Acinetobacter sp.]|uniref:DUF4124 domain-containing protein n=1 Tax=Acinetobacter sp. TaxID=472 RepID=UPI0035AE82BA